MTNAAAAAIQARLDDGPIGQARTAALTAVAVAAAAEGSRAWLVGGAVRDAILGLDPGNDLDIVILGDAGSLARRLAEESGGRPLVHRRFGTATWRTGRLSVDLVAARREEYVRPGALPTVHAGALDDDLARRDFALNAIAIALLPGGLGTVSDPFDGRADLSRGVVRVLHDRSFTDDPTRILRAARFAARLGFALDPATDAQTRAAVAAGALATVSPARLAREMDAVLAEARPGDALAILAALGVLAPWAGARTERTADALPAAWCRLARAAPRLALEARPGGAARKAIWLAGATGQGDASPWQTAGSREAAIAAGVGWRRAAALTAAPPSRLARALSRRPAAAIAGSWLLAPHKGARAALRRHMESSTEACPVDGDALIALGIPRGPDLGRLLERVRDAWRDGVVTDGASALQLAAVWAAQVDGTP